MVALSYGEEAIKNLQGEGIYVDRERYSFPALLLTNMKMSRMSGLALLEWIRQFSIKRLTQFANVLLSSSD